jgi:hypothetical protein
MSGDAITAPQTIDPIIGEASKYPITPQTQPDAIENRTHRAMGTGLNGASAEEICETCDGGQEYGLK